ncbi:MAG: oxygenase MpaB family protein [Stagnimonas sp.]|nr:oxygenase MpaB family protein [Stagnimonas sp.]
MKQQGWTWARQEIAGLDAQVDYHRIAQLSFSTRYGTPIFLHALFSVAFVHNVGMPAMAKILYRDGRGPILRDTRRRNFDSLSFFGELYRHGDGPETRAIAQHLVRVHSNFPIDNAMSLYTLSTLCCLPQRFSERYLGRHGIAAKESQAQFLFWKQIGGLMQIKDIPSTADALLEWMTDFERREMRPSAECTRITEALAHEWASYWLPRPLQPLGRGVFYSLIDPELRERLQLPRPSRFSRALTTLLVTLFFHGKRLLPDPAERHFADYFRQGARKGFGTDLLNPPERAR